MKGSDLHRKMKKRRGNSKRSASFFEVRAWRRLWKKGTTGKERPEQTGIPHPTAEENSWCCSDITLQSIFPDEIVYRIHQRYNIWMEMSSCHMTTASDSGSAGWEGHKITRNPFYSTLWLPDHTRRDMGDFTTL